MPNHYLQLSYDGTNYQGYQWQPGGLITVQSAIEDTLSRIHRAKVTFNGCGRTDAGVHATQYYGHFRTEGALPDRYLFILNKQLPKGIAAHDCFPVPEKAHARFDATERTYDYFFHAWPDAFLERFSSLHDLPNFAPALSAQLLPHLVGEHDFYAFCKTPEKHNTTVCRVTNIQLFTDEATGTRYRLRFVANRFLRGMIRILASDIIAVGTGQTTTAELLDWLKTGEREERFKRAPPEGLFLTGVRYPYANLDPALPQVHSGGWKALGG
ncbi:tRNA pseudouridine(38-40) synthase TruA [Lewinella sp. 4G2]|uniref:tRNA pseudouridine synthase A n=1 Tax=Lewinella sp. 4G2 TaxID=1803372 RepID=UPI0007B49FE1|nr:tRNA pseudouridine synthase A [Lewinella sp. 4G2]OAV43575.1 hypothetical protein A3850_003280 [Lewinella sp. 4G2]